jgi:dTDP-4-dehydrorhamnose reductase/SAM-dependent methyltransferase
MDITKSLIIGGNGMVGSNIYFGIKPLSKECNINNKNSIKNYLNSIEKPSCIIDLVSLNLRDSEKNPINAIHTNINGTLNLFNICKDYNIPFIFISSGAVFSSSTCGKIFEEDSELNPKTIYGATKQAVEQIIIDYPKTIIIRTGWLFGGIQKTHNKYVENAINNLLCNKNVRGSNDFYGSPTYTYDLIEKMKDLIINEKYGIHHIVNDGFASGYEIGIEIAKILNKPLSYVESVSANDVPNASIDRSKSECLISKYKENKLRKWQDALLDYMYKYINNETTLLLKEENNVSNIFAKRTRCRLCNSFDLFTFYNLVDTPPANHFVKEKIHQERIPLSLTKCNKCSHIQLLEIINPTFLYSNYYYVSSTSKTMVEHLKRMVNEFTTRFEIQKSDNILEIGSNDGTSIQSLLDYGFTNVIGVDPAENLKIKHNLPIICDFFGKNILTNSDIKDKKFKLIFSFHACAHIEDIQDVFKTVYELLEDDGIFIMEVGYFGEVVRQKNFDVIYHEHIDYHTCTAMNNFTKNNNMLLFDISLNNIQSGSIQYYICKNNAQKKEISQNVHNLIMKEDLNQIFNYNYLNKWKNDIIVNGKILNIILNSFIKEGKKIAGYGASAKSTTFLYQYNITSDIISYIIDDNILKQNMYSPGFHIPIKSREHLNIQKVDFIIILSWNFTKEILQILEPYMNNGLKIIVPFPNIIIF